MTAQTSRILIYPTTPARLAISGSSDEDSSAAAAAACAKEKGPASLTSKSVQPQLPQAPPPPRLFFWQPATKIGRRNCVMLRWRIGMQWASASSSPASFAMCSASQAKLAWRCCGCGAAERQCAPPSQPLRSWPRSARDREADFRPKVWPSRRPIYSDWSRFGCSALLVLHVAASAPAQLGIALRRKSGAHLGGFLFGFLGLFLALLLLNENTYVHNTALLG